jgi:RHS repeat-associated protein
MKPIKKLFLITLMVVLAFQAKAQTPQILTIESEVPVSTINVCEPGETFMVKLLNTGTVTDTLNSIFLTITMPVGMAYENGSITAFLNKGESTETPINVSPTVTSGSSVLTLNVYRPNWIHRGESVTISYKAQATCAIQTEPSSGGVFNRFNTIQAVYYNNGTTTTVEHETNSYNVKYADLQLTIPDGEKSMPYYRYQEITREIIVKDALQSGSTSNITIKMDHDYTSGFQILSYQIAIVNSNGTYGNFFDLDYVGPDYSNSKINYVIHISPAILQTIGLGNMFDQGEALVIREKAIINNYDPIVTSNYEAQAGCNGNNCLTSVNSKESAYLTFTATHPQLAYNLEHVVKPSICDPNGIMRITIQNTATNPYDIGYNLFPYFFSNFKFSVSNAYIINPHTGGKVKVNFQANPSQDQIYYYINSPSATQDPDGVGGLSDVNKDGNFSEILPNSEVTFEIEYQFLFNLTDANNTPYYAFYTNYTDDNNNNFSIGNYYNGTIYSYSTANFATDLVKDIPSTFKYHIQYNEYGYNTTAPCTSGNFFVRLKLPAGVKPAASPNAVFKSISDGISVPLTLTMNGNDAILSGGGVYGDYSIDLVSDCSLRSSSDPDLVSDSVKCSFVKACTLGGTTCYVDYATTKRNVLIHFDCNEQNRCIDLDNNKGFTVNRTTLGWDVNKVNPSGDHIWKKQDLTEANKVTETTTGIMLDRAYVYDNLKATFKGTINTSLCQPDELHAELSYISPIAQNIIRIADARFAFNGNIIYTINPSAYTINSMGNNKWVIDFAVKKTDLKDNAGNPLTDFPQGAFSAEVNFQVIPDGISREYFSLDELRGRAYFKKDALIVSEESFGAEMLIYNPISSYTQFYSNGNYVNVYIYSSTLNIVDFPNEYRPYMHNKSFSLGIPEGLGIDKITYYVIGHGAVELEKEVDYTLSNNTLTIHNEMLSNALYTNLQVNFNPFKCNVTPIIQKKNLEYSYRDYLTYNANCNTQCQDQEPVYSFSSQLATLSSPSLQVDLENRKSAIENRVTWKISVTNHGYVDQPFSSWVLLEPVKTSQGLIITKVTDENGNNLLFSKYGSNNNNIYVKLGDITYNQTKIINVTSSYTNCVADKIDSINVYTGWDFNNYPATPELSPCKTPGGSLQLVYKTANMQWQVDQVTQNKVNIGDPVDYSVEINSTGIANMYDTKFDLTLPQYVTVPGNITATYGNLTATIPGSSLPLNRPLKEFFPTWDGTFTGNSTIRLNLTANTQCGVDAGRFLFFTAEGTTNCQAPIKYAHQLRPPLIGFDTIYDVKVTANPITFKYFKDAARYVTVVKNVDLYKDTKGGNIDIRLSRQLQYLSTEYGVTPTVTHIGDSTILTWPLPKLTPGDSLVIPITLKVNESIYNPDWSINVSKTGYIEASAYIQRTLSSSAGDCPTRFTFDYSTQQIALPDLCDMIGNSTLALNVVWPQYDYAKTSEKLKWTYNRVPALTGGLDHYTVVVQVAGETENADGSRSPDWAHPIQKTYTHSSLVVSSQDEALLSDLISSPQPGKYYWRAGLISSTYQTTDATIDWSDEGMFIAQPDEKTIVAASFLGSSAHTNDINWNYNVTYLDDGSPVENIEYVDGMGRKRQVQTKNNTNQVILASEMAYSNEGGDVVQTLPAPLTRNIFGYATDFFDIDGRDFGTADFDREEKDASTGKWKLKTPGAVSTNPGSVGWYYSNNNTLEAFVDDARGYPYKYDVAYGSPMKRVWKASQGFGPVLKMTGGKETEYMYGKPTTQELERIYGKAYVRDSMDLNSLTRTIAYNGDGVGSVSYKNNEGKVIATALTSSNAPSLDPLTGNDTSKFVVHVDPLATGKFDESAIEKAAAGRFDIPYGNNDITIKYALDMGSFSVNHMPCASCRYNVNLTIINAATGEVARRINREITPAQAVCDGSTQRLSILDTVMKLTGPASFMVNRSITPLTDPVSGENILQQAGVSYAQNVRDSLEYYKAAFASEYNSYQSFFALRQAYTLSYNKPYVRPMNCYTTDIVAGSEGSDAACFQAGEETGASLGNPGDLTMDNQGNIYATSTANNLVLKVNTFHQVSLFASCPSPVGVAYSTYNANGGYVYVLTSNPTSLVNAYGIQGNLINSFGSRSGSIPLDIHVSELGNVFVLLSFGSNYYVQKYGPTGTFVQEWSISGESNITNLVIKSEDYLYYYNSISHQVKSLNITNNAQEVVFDGTPTGNKMGMDNQGYFYIGNGSLAGGEFYKLEAATHDAKKIAAVGGLGMYVTSGGDIYYSRAIIGHLQRTYCESDQDPCLTSDCGQLKWMVDEVKVQDDESGKHLVELDGYVRSGTSLQREAYDITDTVRIGEISSSSQVYQDFVAAYDRDRWVALQNENLHLYEYAVTGPDGAFNQLPAINDNDSLILNRLLPFHLLRAVIQKSCDLNCQWKDFTLSDCDATCQERSDAYKADMEDAYDNLGKSKRLYRYSLLRWYTLKQLVNKAYPLGQRLTERLTDTDYDLYMEYERSRDLYETFDIPKCVALCRNPNSVDPCVVCGAEYMSSVFENADNIGKGVEYLMKVWNDTVRNSEVFPFTVADFQANDESGNSRLNLALRDSLGTPMFNFLWNAAANNTDATILANWQPQGGNCTNCAPPVKAGCSPVQPFDVSQLPSIVIPLLETENLTCVTNYYACDSMTSTDPAIRTEYLTKQNIHNCIAALGDPASYASLAEYNAQVAQCQTYYTGMAISIPDYPEREGIVRPVLQELYPQADQTALADSLVLDIISKTKDNTLEELQKYMIRYQAEQQCRLSCKADFEAAFAKHITEITTNVQEEIRDKFISQCFGNLNEVMDVSYPFQFYQYTLYHYDAAGRLKATTPPEGVDFVDIYSADPAQASRKPAHRLPSSYTYNSLYNTSATSPDEGRTEFLYDKAGRIRYSQNAQQRSLASQNIVCFSYTKYDDETGRITETGEYRYAVDATVGGFAGADLQSGPFASSQVNNLSWPAFDGREQYQTWMVYDVPTLTMPGYAQLFVDHRLSKSYNTDGAIYYSYDAQGRVKWMVQEIAALGTDKYKTVDYYYLPLTGKVDSVVYQKGSAIESFRHRYLYDDDNRLTGVKVSRDGQTWTDAAKYSYYVHGPLKDMQLGDNIQKVDYVYTINGWLKGINSPVTGTGPADGSTTGRDTFAEALNYFRGDYQRTGTGFETAAAVTLPGSTGIAAQVKDLYSGNISSIVTRTGFDLATGSTASPLMVQAYHYDVLNRIKDAWTLTPTNTTGFTGTLDNSWYMHLDYDRNGNIEHLTRRRDANLGMDQLTYRYSLDATNQKLNNRLLHINDSEPAVTGIPDIRDQGAYDAANPATWNYMYDLRGRLIANKADSIAAITWTAYDKIHDIQPIAGSTKPLVSYTYNSKSQRQTKKVLHADGSYDLTVYTYDASDNMMATYSINHAVSGTETRQLDDLYVYGSKRLGEYKAGIDLSVTTLQPLSSNLLRFELTDHLGNVRAVLTGQPVVNQTPSLLMATDYYAFGMEMPKRVFSSNAYRFNYNGKEIDRETGYEDYGFRIYDPKVARFLSTDPLTKKYPMLTPYQFASNTSIMAIDLDGLEAFPHYEGILNARNKGLVTDKDLEIINEYRLRFAVMGLTAVVDVAITKGWLTRSLMAYEAGNMLDYMSKAEKTNDPILKEQYKKEAGMSGTLVLGSAVIDAALPLIPKGISKFNFLNNPFKGLTPGEAGKMGERLMTQELKELHKDADVLEQVQIDFGGGNYMIADAVVADGKILKVAESKFNTSKLTSQQKNLFERGKIGTLKGKNAGDYAGMKVDPSSKDVQLEEWRWGSEGSLEITKQH